MTADRLPAHLHDMRDVVRELRGLPAGLDVQDVPARRVLCLAVEKRCINLGEAAFRVGDGGPRRWPALPWRQTIGLRNVLAHGDAQVAHEVLYRTVHDELPGLDTLLDAALAEIGTPGR